MTPSLLTSVVIASVVASLVSGVFTSISMVIDRRARRRELIFTKALEFAKLKAEFLKEYAMDHKTSVFIADPAEYAEWYSHILETLHDEGHLPKAWQEEYGDKFGGRES